MNILEQVLSEVLSVSIWSLSVGLVVGGVIGLIFGIVNHCLKLTLLPAIFGSFLGTLAIAFVPLFSIPGLVNGGGYAGVYVLALLVVLVPIGSIAGGIAGSMAGSQRSKLVRRRTLGLALLVTYLLLIGGILLRVVVFRAG